MTERIAPDGQQIVKLIVRDTVLVFRERPVEYLIPADLAKDSEEYFEAVDDAYCGANPFFEGEVKILDEDWRDSEYDFPDDA